MYYNLVSYADFLVYKNCGANNGRRSGAYFVRMMVAQQVLRIFYIKSIYLTWDIKHVNSTQTPFKIIFK